MSAVLVKYLCQSFTSPRTVSYIPVFYTKVGPDFSGLTYKRHVKWKMLRGIYSAIYGEVNVSVSVCVEIKGDYIEI
jgi:hypothetical protein